MNIEEEADKAGWKRLGLVHCAMRLLMLELFKRLHGLSRKTTMCAMESDWWSEWRALQQFCFRAPALTLVVTTSGDEAAHPLQI